MRGTVMKIAAGAGLFAAGFLCANAVSTHAASKQRVFELRTYTAAPGKLDALKARFRNHTVALFKKHGMTNVGYWVPQDAPASQNILIYVLAHEGRDAAGKSFDAFRADPAWVKAREASEVNGRLTEKVESVFMDPADFSPMK
jgi:hypothetical protein